MKYKAVLFDMDGTVLNTLGDLAAAVNHTLREFSMPERSIAEVAAALSNGARLFPAAAVIIRDESFKRLVRAVAGDIPELERVRGGRAAGREC